MLYLLDKDVETVKWNGLPLHETISARVKEHLNGDCTLTLKYPITDSQIYELLTEDKLIKAPVPELGEQLFRIKKPVEMDDHVEVLCYHITDDIMQHSIKPIGNSQVECMTALSNMVQAAKTSLGRFSFTSDITRRCDFNTTETATLYSVLMDGPHSIVGTWEGELVRDNFLLSVQKRRGTNRGVVISTHHNLKTYKRSLQSQNLVTRLHLHSTFKPEGSKEETHLTVTVDSRLLASYPYINEKELTNNDLKTVEELREWGERKFRYERIDRVQEAIVIEAFELDGQTVHLGDTVSLKSRKHHVEQNKKVVAYEYDALRKAYNSLTFDNASRGSVHGPSPLKEAARSLLQLTQTNQDLLIGRALENANRAFDAAYEKQEGKILNGIEQAKAKAAELAKQTKDQVDEAFQAFTKQSESSLQQLKEKAEEALGKTGTLQQAFHQVQETTQLYERLIGSSDKDVKRNIAHIALTDVAYLTKVIDLREEIATVQTQLSNSWSVQHLTSNGSVLNSLNLLANGTNLIHGRLTHITGQTLIDRAVIKSAMVDKLKTANFESGSVTTAILSAEAVTAEKLKVDDALFTKLTATEAYLKKLFSKQAFISQVQSVTVSANKISGGILTAINRAMEVSLNAGQIFYYTDQAALKRVLTGYPTQFVKFATGTVDGKGKAGVTVIGSNRWSSENSNDGGFVGIRAWNGTNVDSMDLVGDELSFASSAYDNKDGWKMTTTGKLQLFPIRKQDRRDSTINAGDIWLYLDTSGNYVSLHEILKRMSNSIGALYEYRGSHNEGYPAWWDTRDTVGRL